MSNFMVNVELSDVAVQNVQDFLDNGLTLFRRALMYIKIHRRNLL
jgi:hypothetical protein